MQRGVLYTNLCVAGLLVPPLLKVLLQFHLGLLQQVLDVLYLCLQLPQLPIQCLEAAGATIIIVPASTR